jgi:hypothetical protein
MTSLVDEWREQAAATLDVRPDLERGDEPFTRIMETAATIQPGATLVLTAPFEPVPLYAAPGERGFSHESHCVSPDKWVIRFTRLPHA